MLADRYRNQGFRIDRFGADSMALKRFDHVVYVFNSGIVESHELVDALCDCHLRITRHKYAIVEEPKTSVWEMACSAA
jgi:hypothetical protein